MQVIDCTTTFSVINKYLNEKVVVSLWAVVKLIKNAIDGLLGAILDHFMTE